MLDEDMERLFSKEELEEMATLDKRRLLDWAEMERSDGCLRRAVGLADVARNRGGRGMRT
jgi:hypothetical protein